MVEPGLGAADELLVGLAGIEEPAVGLVPELAHHGPRQGLGPLQQLGLVGRLEQVQQAGDQEGVVVEIAKQLGLPVLVRVQQQPLVEHPREDEIHGPGAGLPDARVAGDGVGRGHARQHQAVPGDDDLLVAKGLDPLLALLEEARPGAGQHALDLLLVLLEILRRLLDRQDGVQDVLALEVAEIRDIVETAEDLAVLLAEELQDLLTGPHEELALLPLAVGVLGGVEAALGLAHLPQHVLQGFLDDALEESVLGDAVRLGVDLGELAVVVEHLLEVGHQPLVVHGVAVEAAAELVVHTPLGHLPKRLGDHLQVAPVPRQAVGAQEHVEHPGVGELGRPAEAAVGCVVGGRQALRAAGDDLHAQLAAGQVQHAHAVQRRHDLVDVPGDVLRLVAVGLHHRLEHPRKARHAVPVLGRVVGAAEERLPLRGQEHGHGPAAPLGEQLDGVHVDLVQVRPLLPVDLDADEVLVHQRGDGLVLEGLVLHHVAPVAGRVADAQKDRLVFRPGLGECLLSPRVPVHRVAGVLQQVRARLVGQAVHRHVLLSVTNTSTSAPPRPPRRGSPLPPPRPRWGRAPRRRNAAPLSRPRGGTA